MCLQVDYFSAQLKKSKTLPHYFSTNMSYGMGAVEISFQLAIFILRAPDRHEGNAINSLYSSFPPNNYSNPYIPCQWYLANPSIQAVVSIVFWALRNSKKAFRNVVTLKQQGSGDLIILLLSPIIYVTVGLTDYRTIGIYIDINDLRQKLLGYDLLHHTRRRNSQAS